MAQPDELAGLRAEVAALRRRVRALAALALLAAALAAIALARPSRPGGGRGTEFVAQEYRLVDPSGNLRGSWRCPPAGPALTLLDEGGRPAAELRLDPGGGGRLRLTGADGRVLDQRP